MNAPAKNSIKGRKQPVSYDNLLKNSIRYFLGEYPNSILSSSELLSKSDTPIQELGNLPLEIIWFYYAIEFHGAKSRVSPPPVKLILAKALLKLLKKCSCSCNVVKRIAVIAPVLYLLYQLELNFSARDPCLREEIRILLEGIVSYISICCSNYLEGGEGGLDRLWVYILDVIRVWTVDEVRESSNADVMASFFPVLNNEYQQEIRVDMGKMAGAVMNEAFLLRLYLKISQGVNKEDLQRTILMLAIQTIKGFHNFYFLGEDVSPFAV
ncbi:hypothetical protein BUALT_Bualt10G0123100 [Buddleja alternifolia]|uniref:Uncharacterized protein n=1 Tax=Buddleja alternifolia TaxID=168488 RepID=A0AAV6X4R8_9LAMI|nr:hypothetical protein BUALT_Bualt10G0123100 [Buddleja alternifolia]